MKIFITQKKGRRQYFKLFNIIFCIKISNKKYSKYKKYYFNGLLRTSRTFNPLECKMEHKFFLLNILFFIINEQNNYRNFYFHKFLLKRIDLKSFIIKNKIFKKINLYDTAFILNANSGETYLFLKYALDPLLLRSKNKKALLIATKKYHIDLISMICPEIPYIYSSNFYNNIAEDVFEINGTTFIKIFSYKHFYSVEQDIKVDPNAHYYYSILKTLNIKEKEVANRKILELQEARLNMLTKISDLGLNLNKFVFISPEANSCEALDEEFWIDKINSLKKQEFDIFVNLINKSNIYEKLGCKTCYLTYPEAFSLAKMAKKIYSLRSGFTEFLLNTNVPMEVYYSPFKCNDITGEQIKRGFSLLKIPDTNPNDITEIVIKH
jgi:hypothetical protein